MDVTLDVWLSVIRLLLHGGEYFPLDLVVRSYAKGMNGGGNLVPTRDRRLRRVPSGGHLTELTAREIQILEMVSRGLQNKGIAAELRLSEHTVKIHIHNIITKLGVHNRTEAVSRFRGEFVTGAKSGCIFEIGDAKCGETRAVPDVRVNPPIKAYDSRRRSRPAD